MAPQLQSVGSPYSVPVYSSGGFDSVTVKHEMAELFAKQPTHVLHLGDHDPSGVHVFGSLGEDIAAFAEDMGAEVKFSRLAVLPEHVDKYGLLTSPPKATDRRAFTGATVQAEALPPDVLAGLVKQAIAEHLDALKDVCRQHGLDHEAVVKVAGVPWREWPRGEPDTNYQAEVTAELLVCFPD